MGSKGDAKMRFEMALSFLEGESANKTLADLWLRKAYSIAEIDDMVYFAGRVADLALSLKGVDGAWERECVSKLESRVSHDSTGRAMNALMKLAKSKCAWAMNSLGDVYLCGLGVEENDSEAFNWYLKAAELGIPEAIESVAKCYGVGCGVDADAVKAREYLGRALKAYSDLCDQGDSYSQFKLGRAYEKGSAMVSGEKDPLAAYQWYMRAALGGNVEAMGAVSNCYLEGNGVGKDNEKALEWYVKAAENGLEGPISVLTRNYYLGRTVCGIELSREYDKAIHFAKLGVELYNEPSCLAFLGRCYYHGNGVGEDNDTAFMYFKEAAELGDAMAQDYLGDCYKGGYGVEENIGEAKKWYRIAAENGSESAKKSLKKLEEESSGGW